MRVRLPVGGLQSLQRIAHWRVFPFLMVFAIKYPRTAKFVERTIAASLVTLSFVLCFRFVDWLHHRVDLSFLDEIYVGGLIFWPLFFCTFGVIALVFALAYCWVEMFLKSLIKGVFIQPFAICLLRRFDQDVSRTMRTKIAPIVGLLGRVLVVSDRTYDAARPAHKSGASNWDDILGDYPNRLRLDDADWRQEVTRALASSDCAVVDVSCFSENVEWETHTCIAQLSMERVFLIYRENSDLLRVRGAIERHVVGIPSQWWHDHCIEYGEDGTKMSQFRKRVIDQLLSVRSEILPRAS